MKNQEKIIEIWKSGDKVLALILGRSIMTDRQLLNFCQDKADSFSAIHAWKGGWRILRLNIPPIPTRIYDFNLINNYGILQIGKKNKYLIKYEHTIRIQPTT